MSTLHLVPADVQQLYEVHEFRSAAAILIHGHPTEWGDILAFLSMFRLPRSAILARGGRKTTISTGAERWFQARGWHERQATVRRIVDDKETASATHRIDCFRGKVGFEWEWNSKDSVFSRDLAAFRLLHEADALEVGVVVTRADGLQRLFDSLGVGEKYGASTTHVGKLLPRITRGEAGGCPLLVFGITERLYVEDEG